MNLNTRFATLVGATALMVGSSAHADVTAAQVWEDWQRSLKLYGDDTVSVGNTTMDGDTLTVSNVTMALSDDTTTTIVDMGDLQFQELGDGTVNVILAEQYPLIITDKDGDGGVKMSIKQEGLTTIVSGDPSQLTYTFTADRYLITMDEITENGENGENGETLDADIRIAVNGLDGVYTSQPGDVLSYNYDFNAGSFDVLFDLPNIDGNDDRFTLSGQLRNMTSTFAYTVPSDGISPNPADFFKNGFTLNGGYAYDAADMIIDVVSEGAPFTASLSLQGSDQKYDIDGSAMRHTGETNGITISASGATVPLPIELSLSSFTSSLAMPLDKTDEPADVGMSIGINDLQVSEMIWSILDPTNALPHDPATLMIDLTGKMKLLASTAFTQEQLLENQVAVTAEIYALDLNTLKLAIAGAVLSGNGAFTFDNTDLDTFDGTPRPEGSATFTLQGANALIDNLVEMGVIPADQAMMGRMMVGMFARSTGDDELTTTVEINGQGHVIANGQRLQ